MSDDILRSENIISDTLNSDSNDERRNSNSDRSFQRTNGTEIRLSGTTNLGIECRKIRTSLAIDSEGNNIASSNKSIEVDNVDIDNMNSSNHSNGERLGLATITSESATMNTPDRSMNTPDRAISSSSSIHSSSNTITSSNTTNNNTPNSSMISTTSNSAVRRVSFMKSKNNDKAARLLGMDSAVPIGGIGLPHTSETSEASHGSGSAIVRRARFASSITDSFGGGSQSNCVDDEGSVITYEGDASTTSASTGKKKKKFRGRVVSKLKKSMRRTNTDESVNKHNSGEGGIPSSVVHFSDSSKNADWNSGSGISKDSSNLRGRMARGMSGKWAPGIINQRGASSMSCDDFSESLDNDMVSELPAMESRKSVSLRRDNLDVKSLTMGLDLESANFLDWMAKAKCQEWLKSLSQRDPRACIKGFFDDVARDGADRIEEEKGFQPEMLSPLLSMFQRSSVFSVWRPTSQDSIRKMMTGQGTGKGLDIKGKSAKKGKLSAYVPFLQIHEDAHKKKIRALPRDGRIRIFYKKREARDNAHTILSEVMGDMMETSNMALLSLIESDKVSKEELAQDECPVGRVISSFRTLSVNGLISQEETRQIDVVNEWSMEQPSIIVIDDYSPKCYGLDMPKRLFWEGYVTRAADISRKPGSVYDTGRPSRASFQDMNFGSIKNEFEEGVPRAVVWQYTDPYLPPTEPDPDPMMPQTLLMAYEEMGRVMPVVSDFDCFLLGTRGVRFHNPLPEEQVELVHGMLTDIEKILKDNRGGKSNNWTSSWLNEMKHHKKNMPMPKLGFGDPKSYAIMKYAVQRLEEFGAVRHGAECFNFYFPQELDDEFLVIGGNLGGEKYKYMKLRELQGFLSGCIDLGFTFPLNPKWVLCDEGWKSLWDKLTGSKHPNVEMSINAWYPPGSGLRERIKEIHDKNPEGFQSDLSNRKKGTQAWDEAEIALDRYQRIQRAKRKLWAVLCWISIVQQSRKNIQARLEESESEKAESAGEEMETSNGDVQRGENGEARNGEEISPEKRVSFQDPSAQKRLSTCSVNTFSSDISLNTPLREAIANMGELNTSGIVRARSGPPLPTRQGSERFNRSSSVLSEGEEQNIEVIESLLNNNLPLSEFQSAGLQRIRDQLVAKSSCSQPRINNRMERRHTSIDGRITAMMLEDVPSFILKEYGGVKGDSTISFKSQVKKIMNAQRLIQRVKLNGERPKNGNAKFLPVEWTTMSIEAKRKLAEKLSFESLKRWDFNMIEVAKLCNGSPLLFVGWAIMGSPLAQQAMAKDLEEDTETEMDGYNFISEFSVQMPILCSFLRTVEADYLPNPYHNNTHAADVLQTLNTMLQLGGKLYASSSLDIFSILVAAVIHDVKHPGLNNNFQINSSSELAVQYNDVSVLENYSITWLFSKLLGQTRDFTVDIFSGLSNEQFSKARSMIIRSVLETDMTHHFALLKKMGIHQDMLKGKPAEDWLQTYTNEGVNYDPSMDMLCFLLHQADISNPAKPYPLFVEWADSILSESYAQGDKEASLSLPISPLCDRVTTAKKQSQIGFIKFVVQPSYQLLGEIIPPFARTVFPYIEKSLDFWDNYEEHSDI